jgi:hypothetical protein
MTAVGSVSVEGRVSCWTRSDKLSAMPGHDVRAGTRMAASNPNGIAAGVPPTAVVELRAPTPELGYCRRSRSRRSLSIVLTSSSGHFSSAGRLAQFFDPSPRQGVVETLADLGFDPAPLAEAVIKAADGDVIRFPGSPRGH